MSLNEGYLGEVVREGNMEIKIVGPAVAAFQEVQAGGCLVMACPSPVLERLVKTKKKKRLSMRMCVLQ